MAANPTAIEEGDKENTVVNHIYLDVDESQIAGATLLCSEPENASKAELLRWLKCRKGASLTGKKSDLIERYVIFRYKKRTHVKHYA